MSAEIVEHGKLSKERNKFIYFECQNPKCECKFKIRDNDKDLNIITTRYGFFLKKRRIEYCYHCPECMELTKVIELPDECDDI